jgi:hypothetical protein
MKNAFYGLAAEASEAEATLKFIAPTQNPDKVRLIVSFDGTDRQACYIFKECFALSGARVGDKCMFMLEPSKDGLYMNVTGICPL